MVSTTTRKKTNELLWFVIKMLLKKSKLITVLYYFSLVTVSTAVTIRSAQNHARKHLIKRQVELADDGLKLFIRNLFPDIVKVIFFILKICFFTF